MADKLIEQIKQKDVDVAGFSKSVLNDKALRDTVVSYAAKSTEIMLYYNSYYIISDAAKKSPELFYEYWDTFVSLLQDKNSYKRDIGLTMISNIIESDTFNKFDEIYEKYISLINDIKFMTGECCVNNLKNIALKKNTYTQKIVETLLDIESLTSYTEKQTAVLKSSALDVLWAVFDKSECKGEIIQFTKQCLKSISPKTRKTAKGYLREL